MTQAQPTIFSTPEQFEEYHSRVVDRLQLRWEEQVALLRNGIERLRSLLTTAQTIHDVEMEQELSGHLTAAEQRLAALETAAPRR